MPKDNSVDAAVPTRKAPVVLTPATTDLSLWTHYQVTLRFTTQLCGSVPGDPELTRAWLEARAPRVRPPGGMSMEEIQQEVSESLEQPAEPEELSVLVFQRHEGVCVVRASTIRSHLKESARV